MERRSSRFKSSKAVLYTVSGRSVEAEFAAYLRRRGSDKWHIEKNVIMSKKRASTTARGPLLPDLAALAARGWGKVWSMIS